MIVQFTNFPHNLAEFLKDDRQINLPLFCKLSKCALELGQRFREDLLAMTLYFFIAADIFLQVFSEIIKILLVVLDGGGKVAEKHIGGKGIDREVGMW